MLAVERQAVGCLIPEGGQTFPIQITADLAGLNMQSCTSLNLAGNRVAVPTSQH